MKFDKGMSQILVLIVAAAVLMMVGLLLISLSSGSITDTFQNTQSAACTSQLESQCETENIEDGTTISDIPASCENNGETLEVAEDYEC